MMDLEIINEGNNMEAEVNGPACCDLLSIAMGNLPAGCAWVTIMSNINTLAVATLTDAACVILALGTAVTDEFREKAAETGITVFRTELPIFEAALEVYKAVNGETDL
jgi:hypothetical protein